jgi:hypothetical protein
LPRRPSAFAFTRRNDGSYFGAADRVVMRFLRDTSGQVVALDWFEGGRSSPARRMR